MAQLTVSWEEGLEVAFERKNDQYLDLTTECREAGWPGRQLHRGNRLQGICGSIRPMLLEEWESPVLNSERSG